MKGRRSRRRFLTATGAGFAALVGGCATQTDETEIGTRSYDAGSTATPPRDEPPDSGPTGGPQTLTATPSESFSEDVRGRARETGLAIRESVVKVQSSRGSAGTGWVYGDGQVVTNSHVVEGGRTYELETFDGTTTGARRVGYHEDLAPDVALLETDLSGPTPLPTGDVTSLEWGQPLVQVGHPGRVGDWIIGLGRFAAYREGIDWVLSTVPGDQGNSGSPLVTLDGEVVGVVSGGTSGPNGREYSKSDRVFTEYPRSDELSTAVAADTLESSIDSWT